jgi:PEGA domain
MRISASLLVLCAVLSGCNSSVDSANVDEVVVSSNPPAAAIRLNGEPVGRTPTTIKLDRTKNYELQVGKGGFVTETTELKPRLITTSEGIEYGFPATVRVNLTKIPAAGEAGVPPSDTPEFKKLSKKALGEQNDAAREGLREDIAATKEAATKIQAALAIREAGIKARLAEIAKHIADAKASKAQDATAKAKLAEAELALQQANAEAEAARAYAAKNLKSVEDRRSALSGSETKVVAAKADVAKAAAAVKSDEDRLARLELAYTSEIKALNESQVNSNAAIKALNARADELNRVASLGVTDAKAEAAKGLADLQKALEEQKSAAAKANEALAKAQGEAAKNSSAAAEKAVAKANDDLKSLQSKVAASEKAVADERLAGDAKVAEAIKASEKALVAAKAEAAKAIATANQNAEKTLADERLAAEAKLADANAKVTEANKVAEAAKAKTEALKYSEFSSRYALLESRRRAKSITEEEYKASLSGLRKELGL